MTQVNPANNFNIKINPKNNNPNNQPKNNIGDFKSTDLRILNNFKKDLVSFKGLSPLDMFTVPPNMQIDNCHIWNFMDKNISSVFSQLKINSGTWSQTAIDKSKTIIPWKMHIYADTEEDWAKLTATVGRYLNTKHVMWKTLSITCSIDELNEDDEQKGKAFTIYPASQEQFKQLASDIDYIVRLNNLEKEDSNIIGDRKLGNTGRIFYRFENKSGETKNKTYRLDNDEDIQQHHKDYDSNRGGDQYLASDMTTEDDPFFEFNPEIKV